MSAETGLRLEFSTNRAPIDALDAINAELSDFGAHVSPLDTGRESDEIRNLLSKVTPTPEELQRLKSHFLLSRNELLEVITAAGREPQVPGGGALTTHIATYDYDYPQLYIAEAGVDYTRFERFHVNAAEDGTGVDEVLQILWGEGVEVHLQAADDAVLTLHLDCRGTDQGWIVTYDGEHPHIATVSGATPGTKVLVQVIGAPRWSMNYVEE